MTIRAVRLGSPRLPEEGLRLGTVRHPPRGVPKAEQVTRDFYDVWLPELAPSAPLVKWALSEAWTDKRWDTYVRTYRREMRQPTSRHLMGLIAALSERTNLSVGCYCEEAQRCHRSLLIVLLAEAGAKVSP